jgi:hypothetical protein
MGIGQRKDVLAAGATKDSSETVVIFTEDDLIRDLPEHLKSCGWIPLSAFPNAHPGVWRVTIRGMEKGAEFPSFRQLCDGFGRPVFHRIPLLAAKKAAHTALKRVEWVDEDGKRQVIKRIKGNEQLDDLIDDMSATGKPGAEGYAIQLLALAIEALTLGRSIESCYGDARKFFGVDDEDSEEGAGDVDPSKSA